MKKEKAIKAFLACLKGLIPILVLAPLVFLTFRMWESHMSDLANQGVEGYFSGTGFFLFLSIMVLLPWNAVLSVLGWIGFFLAGKLCDSIRRSRERNILRGIALAPCAGQILYLTATFIILHIQ